MHDTEQDMPLQQPAQRQGDSGGLSPSAPAHRKQALPARPLQARRGLIGRVLGFFARCFGRKEIAKEMNAAQRAAALRASQATPPVTFVGQTTSTLVTPMGAYAGKPLEQALRKRAEQQFAAMDITQTTMH